jgi:hypothetical protein
VWLALRNLRLKRGDAAGAARLVAASFAIAMLSEITLMHYTGDLNLPWRMFVIAAIGFAQCVFLGMSYLAIEPYVRRRCPHVLISWARLLQSGPRDPLVGAHVLAGASLGVLMGVLLSSITPLRVAVGHQADDFLSTNTAVWGPRQFVANLIGVPWEALFQAMLLVFFFFLVRVLLQRDWLAVVALLVLCTTLMAGPKTAPVIDLPTGVMVVGIAVFALLRYGLPGLIACILVVRWLGSVPITLDTSRWYFGYALVDMLMVAALAVWAFRTSLRGQRLLRDETLG